DMLVSLALGLSLTSMNYVDMATEALADALDSADETHDYMMAIELYEQVGAILRCRGRYAEAADFYEDGLFTLHALGGAALLNDPVSPHLELGLAASLMSIGRYDDALLHLVIAREVARKMDDAFLLARIDVATAIIHSAQGDARAALPLILAARDVYAHATSPAQRAMRVRVQAQAAGILLDVAKVITRRERDIRGFTYVELAGQFAQQALNDAVDSGDMGGFYMATLARARHERISGRQTSTLHLLAPLLKDAELTHDPTLAVQVHTAIAQEFAARKDPTHAREAYQRAFQGASECGAIFLGEYAKRELLRGSLALN
ncbi:MAG TPA: hypothetical protein VGR57_11430, partial [Ktedonobacterales bacterium]|nr:hypothetical protein [Ktedonobacterales bacterium]